MEKSGSIESLLSKIREDSERQAEDILKRAQESADFEIRKAEKQAETIHREILERSSEAAAREKTSRLSSVGIEVRRYFMQEKEAVFSEVIERMEKDFVKYRKQKDYVLFVENALLEACLGVGGGSVSILAGKRELEILTKPFLDRVTKRFREKYGTDVTFEKMEVDPRDLPGLTASKGGGRIIFNNTLPALISRKKEKLKLFINDCIFEGES